jgi:hypothetical protein
MAYRRIQKSQEEEKKEDRKGGNLAGTAIAGDIPGDIADDKSDISALTRKTAKSNGGKALDKHCSVCKKTISGINWSTHVKKVHKGL